MEEIGRARQNQGGLARARASEADAVRQPEASDCIGLVIASRDAERR